MIIHLNYLVRSQLLLIHIVFIQVLTVIVLCLLKLSIK